MTGWNETDVKQLRDLGTESKRVDQRTRAVVKYLREQGCPWSVIGAALGVTKQSVQRKYGR